MTGSPFDLSITTVRSMPLLPSGENTATYEIMLTPSPLLTAGSSPADQVLWTQPPMTADKLWSLGAPSLSPLWREVSDTHMATAGLRWMGHPDRPLLVWNEVAWSVHTLQHKRELNCILQRGHKHVPRSGLLHPHTKPQWLQGSCTSTCIPPTRSGELCRTQSPVLSQTRPASSEGPARQVGSPHSSTAIKASKLIFPSMTRKAGSNNQNNYWFREIYNTGGTF